MIHKPHSVQSEALFDMLMNIDEKTALILNRFSQHSTSRAVYIPDLCNGIEGEAVELKEVLKRFETEGYATTYEPLGYGHMVLTSFGKKVGMHDMYLELLNQQREKARQDNIKESTERRGKTIERVLMAITSIGTIIIGVWGNILNQDIKDVKDGMDSIRVEMRELRKTVEVTESLLSKQLLMVQPQIKSTSDTLFLFPTKRK